MKHTRKQKEAQLLAEAQSVIEEFLNWEEQTDKPNLTQIEDDCAAAAGTLGAAHGGGGD